jgi:hypothetical protein
MVLPLLQYRGSLCENDLHNMVTVHKFIPPGCEKNMMYGE